MKNKDFSLVLSGGGALGIAHLGVIEDLEKKGVSPKEIVGTSMGAIIGACYAIGLNSKEIEALLNKFSKINSWFSYTHSTTSLIDTKKVKNILTSVFGIRMMADTKIPLKLIATDLKDGNSTAFEFIDEILIVDAILASMAVPGIFKEILINDRYYVDGFLSSNLGVEYARYDDILAVDVLGKASYNHELPTGFFKTAKMINMFEKSMKLIIYNQTKDKIDRMKDKNIILLEPKTEKYKSFNFSKVSEIKKLGNGLF